jgi:transposase
MNWPANLLDLDPIENVWRILKHRIGKRFLTTQEQARQYIEEEWAKLEVSDFSKYTLDMRERCIAVIQAAGGHTKW